VFRAANVKARGEVLVARDPVGILIGTVSLVLSGSQACRFAESDEAEIHLLCVSPSHRRQGVGHALVEATLTAARRASAKRILLWTQPSMAAAQALYEKLGFERIPAFDFSRGGRSFRVYARRI
jgi:ribosomal protein S18 acetylase RimI-like enzyme